MNNDFSNDPRGALEARLTALLLGELSEAEAAEVRAAIAQDPALAKLRARLARTIDLVRDAAATAMEPATAPVASLKLSDDRRQKLLAHFKTVAPQEFGPRRKREYSWLVPMAAAIAILLIGAFALLPTLSKAKSRAQYDVAASSYARREELGGNLQESGERVGEKAPSDSSHPPQSGGVFSNYQVLARVRPDEREKSEAAVALAILPTKPADIANLGFDDPGPFIGRGSTSRIIRTFNDVERRGEIVTATVPVKNTSAGELKMKLESVLPSTTAITVNPGDNTVTIADGQATVSRLTDIVAQLDAKPRQTLIEDEGRLLDNPNGRDFDWSGTLETPNPASGGTAGAVGSSTVLPSLRAEGATAVNQMARNNSVNRGQTQPSLSGAPSAVMPPGTFFGSITNSPASLQNAGTVSDLSSFTSKADGFLTGGLREEPPTLTSFQDRLKSLEKHDGVDIATLAADAFAASAGDGGNRMAYWNPQFTDQNSAQDGGGDFGRNYGGGNNGNSARADVPGLGGGGTGGGINPSTGLPAPTFGSPRGAVGAIGPNTGLPMRTERAFSLAALPAQPSTAGGGQGQGQGRGESVAQQGARPGLGALAGPLPAQASVDTNLERWVQLSERQRAADFQNVTQGGAGDSKVNDSEPMRGDLAMAGRFYRSESRGPSPATAPQTSAEPNPLFRGYFDSGVALNGSLHSQEELSNRESERRNSSIALPSIVPSDNSGWFSDAQSPLNLAGAAYDSPIRRQLAEAESAASVRNRLKSYDSFSDSFPSATSGKQAQNAVTDLGTIVPRPGEAGARTFTGTGAGGAGGRVNTPGVPVVADTAGNRLVIRASSDQLAQVSNLLAKVDKPASDASVTERLSLNNADPTEMAAMLGALFPDPGAAAASGARAGGRGYASTATPSDAPGKVSVVADERTRSLSLTGSPEMLAEAKRFVEELDANETGVSKVYTVKVDNVDAALVANALKQVFPARNTTASETAPTAAAGTPILGRERGTSVSTSGTGRASAGTQPQASTSYARNGTANFTYDPETRNLIVVSDDATMAKVSEVVAELDKKPAAANQPGISLLRERGYLMPAANRPRPEMAGASGARSSDTRQANAVIPARTSVQDGLVLFEMGRIDEAEAMFRKARDLDPNNQSASYYLNLVKEQRSVLGGRERGDAEKEMLTRVSEAWIPASRANLPVPNSSARLKSTNAVFGSYDGTTNRPVVYPNGMSVADSEQAVRNSTVEDRPVRKPATNAPIPQAEVQAADNAFSTFSLNVSDVAFKLAAASLEKGQMPDAATVRSEEFINAFDYRDPEPKADMPIGFAWERARYPFAHNRDLLRFSVKTGAAGRQQGRPLNLVLLLDNSGSMERADRAQIIREALRVLASQLQPQDKISVITFSRTARLWVDGVAGNQAGEVFDQVGNLTPQGGTNLEEAMNLAYATALKHYLANGMNRVVILTDGAANLGNVEPEALKQKVEAHRKQGVALDAFGIGWEGFNDDLLETLTRNGDGRYGFINSPAEAATEFAGQLAGALKVAASDVKVQVEFNPKRVTSYRQIGYAKHQLTKEQFRDNTVDAAELAAQEAGNALYTVEVNPAGSGPIGTVRVRFKVPGTTQYREHAWDVPFTGNAVAMEQASPAMRLAATASAFSEWLVASPYAGEVTPDALLGYLSGVPEICGADERPKKLEWMIRQARSVVGK